MKQRISKEAKRHLAALVSMSLGSFGVLHLIHVMNADQGPPPTVERESRGNFQVERSKPPPKKTTRPKPKARKRHASAQRVPTPQLGPALRGASFNLPRFSADNLAEAGSSLLGETNRKLAMTEGAVDVIPKPSRRVQPKYPKRARERGDTGYVRMSIFVDESGRVGTVRVLDAKPRGVFDEAATTAVQDWEFQPGQYDGQTVGTWVTQTVRFELKKS